LNTLDGTVISTCQERHRHEKFLRLIDKSVPADLEIHLIADNYRTHKHDKVQRWLARHERFHMHFTPTSASWLNDDILEKVTRARATLDKQQSV